MALVFINSVVLVFVNSVDLVFSNSVVQVFINGVVLVVVNSVVLVLWSKDHILSHVSTHGCKHRITLYLPMWRRNLNVCDDEVYRLLLRFIKLALRTDAAYHTSHELLLLLRPASRWLCLLTVIDLLFCTELIYGIHIEREFTALVRLHLLIQVLFAMRFTLILSLIFSRFNVAAITQQRLE